MSDRRRELEIPKLAVENLRAGYDGVPVLFDVNFDIWPAEIVVLCGGNGAGKSTMLKAIMGTVQVLGGEMRLDDQKINKWPPHRRTKAGISFSPEGRRVFATLSVKENLHAGASHVPTAELEERCQEVYEYFPVLGEREGQLAGTLSGGEQQMVAIGRALMPRPDLILVEEPSQGLAPVMVDRVYHALQRICLDRGVSVLIAEQFQQLRENDCDRVLVIDKGTVVPYESLSRS
ncbi:MAG TPA: ABC transporter ATP-binding protein [Sporichthyaceae bacterium]|nr:ABC transporter ATP-binding protein [Sporichthyaceae bacterium]